jgi:hypothetical protein
LFQALLNVRELVHFGVQRGEARGGAIRQITAEQGNAGNGLAQGDEIARGGQAQRGAAGQAFEILHAAQILPNFLAQHGLRLELGDGIEAGFDLRPGKLRAQNPGAEQARAHDDDGLIDGAE